MARKENLEFVDKAVESASLQEQNRQQASSNRDKKIKTIQIRVDWEEKIKAYHGGTITSYITMAIQEKMRRDGIL